MKIIFSYWPNAKPEHGGFFKEIAAVSHYFVKQHGYETVLFTDAIGESYLHKIGYDNIVRFPDGKLNLFPTTGWSLGKLLAMSMMKEPFFHLDFDLFLFKPIDQYFINQDAVFFHHEIWMDKVMANSSFLLRKKPEEISDIKNFRSYNCAIVGGKNFEAFNQYAGKICDFAIEHSNLMEILSRQQRKLKRKELVPDFLYLAMLLEQLWLPQFLVKNNIKISTVLNSPEMEIFNSKDYAEGIDVKNFMQQTENIQHENDYKTYYKLLNKAANENGYVHYFAKNKLNYKEKIIAFANQKGLSY